MTAPAIPRDPAPRYAASPDADGGVARDPRLQRAVALRRLDGAVDAARVEAFLRAARLQARLEHPAIPPVLDLGVDADGRPYAALRPVLGVPLDEALRRRAEERDPDRRLPTRRLLAAYADVCLAVAHAHRQGVAHGGLGASTVMLGELGEVSVLGWEHAVEVGAHGAAAQPAEPGDPARPAADPRVADVPALGALLFLLLCDAPLPAAPAGVLPAAEVHAAARAAGRFGPPELLDACAAAVDPDAARRPTPAALAATVRGWLDGVRDLARRRELAARHRQRARQLAEAGDRAAAMREAGSALALAPDDAVAAELAAELALAPPDPGAPEAVAAIAASDRAATRALAAAAAWSYLAVPGFVLLLAVLGVRDLSTLVGTAVVGLAQAGFAAAVARGRVPGAWPWVAAAGNAVMLVLFSRLFGPLLATPAMAATVATATASVPGLRAWWAPPAIIALGLVAPWGLEALGVLAPVTTVTAEGVVVAGGAVALPPTATLVVLAVHGVALLAVATAYTRTMAVLDRAARLRLLTQAWHLEHLAWSREVAP